MFALSICLVAALVFGGAVSAKAQESDYPEIINAVAPVIPAVAIAVRAKGKVTVDLSLKTNGKVESAKAVQGHPFLRKATEDAVLQWKFARGKEARDLRLIFDYTNSVYDGRGSVLVSPYGLDLEVKLTVSPEFPETESYIPKNWQPKTDRCEIHGELLKKDRVEIVYGLLRYKKGFLEAEEKLFPHANTYAGGGCVIDSDTETGQQISPKYAEVLYCSKCRKAQKKWSRENRDKSFD